MWMKCAEIVLAVVQPLENPLLGEYGEIKYTKTLWTNCVYYLRSQFDTIRAEWPNLYLLVVTRDEII